VEQQRVTHRLPVHRSAAGERAGAVRLRAPKVRARFYDPYLGRFISADTIVPNPRNPQDFNRYAYTRNNPLKYTNPSGHAADVYGNSTRPLPLPPGAKIDPQKVKEVMGFMAMGVATVMLPEVVAAVGAKEFIIGAGMGILGYYSGSKLTGQSLDPVEAFWAGYFGGLPNPISASSTGGKFIASALWGGGGNTLQSAFCSWAKGETLTAKDVGWSALTGSLAGGSGQVVESAIDGFVPNLQKDSIEDALTGYARSTVPPISGDITSQVSVHAAQQSMQTVNESLKVAVGEFIYHDYYNGGYRERILKYDLWSLIYND